MLTSSLAKFTAADNNLSVSGAEVPPGATITVLTSTTAKLNGGATFNDSGSFTNQLIEVGDTYQSTDARTVDDAVFGGGGTTITSTAARFDTSAAHNDVGLQVYGTGITEPCYVASNTATVTTLSSACASGTSDGTVTIGDPSASAPNNGEFMLDQGVQEAIAPPFGADPTYARPCADNVVESTHYTGVWRNPGSFAAVEFSAFGDKQPPGTKAIGQLVFTLAPGTTWAAWVIETPPSGDSVISALHYNIVFPLLPIVIAGVECPATATSPGVSYTFDFAGATPSQGVLPPGVTTELSNGRPGTAQLRATRDNAQAGSTTTAYLTSEDPSHPLVDTGQYHRLCIVPAGAPTIGFQCGAG